MDYLMTFITALLGGGLVGFVEFLIKRYDEKSGKSKAIIEKIDCISQKLDKTEKDNVRTQLLLLMSDYPDRVDEIIEVAHHYFVDDKGNWYMTTLFSAWCKEHDIEYNDFIKG